MEKSTIYVCFCLFFYKISISKPSCSKRPGFKILTSFLSSSLSPYSMEVDKPDHGSKAIKGPFIALEPWSGLSTSLEEGDRLEEKKDVRILKPDQVDHIGFDIEIL